MSGPNDTPMNDDNQDSRDPMQLSDDLQRFEAELVGLCPRDDRLNRERLMFLAGQAVAGPNDERATVLGMNLESRAWPAAFAAMTAVAATLLVMLVTKPDRSVAFPPAETAFSNTTRFVTARENGRLVLSTIDAHLRDIDRLLAMGDSYQSDADRTAVAPVDIGAVPVLTPGRWHEVLNESEAVDNSSNGASILRLMQGATS